MEVNDLVFEIKGVNGFLKINPMKRVEYNSPNVYDNNWIETYIGVKAAFLSGGYKAFFLTTDFYFLRCDLTKLYENFNEKIVFSNLEHDLVMEIAGDGYGHFEAKILVFDVHLDLKLEYIINSSC